MARIAPEKTNFFVRSNYQVGVLNPSGAWPRSNHQQLARSSIWLSRRYAGSKKESKPRPRYANYGLLLSSSETCAPTTLVSEWLRRISTKLPPSLRCTSAPELL